MKHMKSAIESDIDVYRVGVGRDIHIAWEAIKKGQLRAAGHRARWFVESCTRRSYWGFWQAEFYGVEKCPRGITRNTAMRKAKALVNATGKIR